MHITAHHKKIYIVTNGMLATQTARMVQFSIKHYIADFFVSDYVPLSKT